MLKKAYCLGVYVLVSTALSLATCTPKPTAPTGGKTLQEESGADVAYSRLMVDLPACTSAKMRGCPTTITDLQNLQSAALSAAAITLSCAADPATPSADKDWYSQRAAFWITLRADMSAQSAAVADGTYRPTQSWQLQFVGSPTPTLPAISGMPGPGTKKITGSAQAVDEIYSTKSKIYVCVWSTAPAKGASLGCTTGSVKPADLSDGEAPEKTDVEAATNGSFTANLTNPLQAGQFVSITEISTPSGGTAQTSSSASALAITAPSTPAVNGPVDDGDPSVDGKGQPVKDPYNTQSKVYVCVWPAAPVKGASLDCTTGSVKPASLKGSDNHAIASADYVLANAKDGTFSAKLITPLKGGEFVSLVEISSTAAGDQPAVTSAATQVQAPAASGSSSSLYTLALVGLNSTGTSSSGPSLQYFISFDTMAPLPFFGKWACGTPAKPNYSLEHKCWVWMNPRISSVPAAANTALTSFSSSGSLASGVGGQTVAGITQTFDFQGGIAYDFVAPWNGTQFGYGKNWAKATLGLVAAGGSTTPFNPTTTASEYVLNNNLGAQFTNNPALAATYPVLARALCNTYGYAPTPSCTTSPVTYKNVAFVLPSRSRFYSDYSVGLRFKTYFFTGLCKGDPNSCTPENTYPGTFDLRFGQDETVTAGILRGVVMTLAGSYPLPGTSGALRIFGAAFNRLHQNHNTMALALLPTVPSLSITDPSVVIQPINSSDQDYYRLGIGVDLIPLISKWANSASKNASSGAAPTGQ